MNYVSVREITTDYSPDIRGEFVLGESLYNSTPREGVKGIYNVQGDG